MAQLPNTINPEDHQETQEGSYEPIPAGTYTSMVTNSEMKPTKAGTGQYLELTFTICSDKYNGRKFWERLNLSNPNPTAVEIAERNMASLARACGLQSCSDSDQLHDKPVNVLLKVKSGNAQYDATNEVAGYQSVTGVMQQPAAPAGEVWKNSDPMSPF